MKKQLLFLLTALFCISIEAFSDESSSKKLLVKNNDRQILTVQNIASNQERSVFGTKKQGYVYPPLKMTGTTITISIAGTTIILHSMFLPHIQKSLENVFITIRQAEQATNAIKGKGLPDDLSTGLDVYDSLALIKKSSDGALYDQLVMNMPAPKSLLHFFEQIKNNLSGNSNLSGNDDKMHLRIPPIGFVFNRAVQYANNLQERLTKAQEELTKRDCYSEIKDQQTELDQSVIDSIRDYQGPLKDKDFMEIYPQTVKTVMEQKRAASIAALCLFFNRTTEEEVYVPLPMKGTGFVYNLGRIQERDINLSNQNDSGCRPFKGIRLSSDLLQEALLDILLRIGQETASTVKQRITGEMEERQDAGLRQAITQQVEQKYAEQLQQKLDMQQDGSDAVYDEMNKSYITKIKSLKTKLAEAQRAKAVIETNLIEKESELEAEKQNNRRIDYYDNWATKVAASCYHKGNSAFTLLKTHKGKTALGLTAVGVVAGYGLLYKNGRMAPGMAPFAATFNAIGNLKNSWTDYVTSPLSVKASAFYAGSSLEQGLQYVTKSFCEGFNNVFPKIVPQA